jgi:hypothetical protein
VTLHSLFSLLRLSAADPQDGARRVIGLDLPPPVWWQALVVVVIASVILTEIATLAVPSPGGMMEMFRLNPVMAAGVQFALLWVMVHALHRIGRAFGGTGGFEGSVAVIVWLQAMLVALQAVQLVVLLLLPPLAGLIGLAGIVLFFWVLTGFVMALHGFASRGLVLVGIVGSFIGIVVALSLVLAMLGITLGVAQ